MDKLTENRKYQNIHTKEIAELIKTETVKNYPVNIEVQVIKRQNGKIDRWQMNLFYEHWKSL